MTTHTKTTNSPTSTNSATTAASLASDDFQTIAMHVSIVTLVGNLILSTLKLIAGFVANSTAMISDSVHSASDVLSTIVVMIGVKLSSREADRDHPYGHERLECVASIILATMLVVVGLGIGHSAIETIFSSNIAEIETPGILALIAAVVSIIVKELMYHYTVHAAKQIQSPALKADAWHHRSDALSSVGALIGIAGARLGLPILDPIASLAICVFILHAAWEVFQDSVNKMVDHACDEATEAKFRAVAQKVKGVIRIDSLKTREFGNKIYVDMEIAASGKLTLHAAHEIAEAVHDKLETDFPEIKHCMVHVNPD